MSTTFSMKYGSRIGTWNVRTLLQTSKLSQLCKEFKKYKLLVLGIAEMRWLDSGEMKTSEGLKLLFSGKPNGSKHQNGVGFLLSKEAQDALIEWKPHSDRIISIRLRSRARKISIIQCYAPTEVAEPDVKEEFYSSLTSVLSAIHRGDIMILMGDFNAQLGCDNNGYERVMGQHGCGSMSVNGDLLTELCLNNNLVIGGTLFPHRNVHKVTWVSPDHRTENQIDHIAISNTWRGSLLDVRNKRGADVASDHHLVIAKIRLKVAAITRDKNCNIPKRFDVKKLQQPMICKKFTETLKSSGETLLASNNSQWNAARDLFLTTAERTIGFCSTKRKEWISDHTWNLIQCRKEIKGEVNMAKTRTAKKELQKKYSEMDHKVKKSARSDKRRWFNQLAQDAQAAADTNRTRDMYKIVKQMTNRTLNVTKPLKNDEGILTSSKLEQIAIWEKHYANMLSIPPISVPKMCRCHHHVERDNIPTHAPSLEETIKAIKSLKNHKAPGPDNIPPELLKADPITSAKILLPIIRQFWAEESLPEDTKVGIIINLPKKGDLSDCKNWRGITLLCIINKICAHIINTRLMNALDPHLRKEQAGFRPQRSCIDHVNSVRIIVEQSLEWRSPLYLTFVDFEKAFDKLQHQAIWNALECKGVPHKIINLIRAMYHDASCRINYNQTLSNKVIVMNGVRQGCVLSPLLFNIVLDNVLSNAIPRNTGITWGLDGMLDDLDYADDICLFSHKSSHMSAKLQTLCNMADKCGLRINVGKTKTMSINTSSNIPFTMYGAALESVTSFTYLGSIISSSGGSNEDIKSRLSKAKSAFGMLSSIWQSTAISRDTKIKIFNANVKSVLLYACETWNPSNRELQTIQAFVNRCLRRILRIFWPNIITNNELWVRTWQTPIRSDIKRRKWSWLGHILRKPQDDITRQSIEWSPQGSRRRGRPSKTWRRLVEIEAAEVGVSWGEIKYIAIDKTRWKSFVEALCS